METTLEQDLIMNGISCPNPIIINIRGSVSITPEKEENIALWQSANGSNQLLILKNLDNDNEATVIISGIISTSTAVVNNGEWTLTPHEEKVFEAADYRGSKVEIINISKIVNPGTPVVKIIAR